MNKSEKQSSKVKVQVNVTPETNMLLKSLQKKLSLNSRSDLLMEAFHLFALIAEELKSGRRIVSLNPDELEACNRYKEIISPTLFTQMDKSYQYLVSRPHPWRKQLFIKGRNMTVAHLIYSIRTNKLSPEEAAQNYDLPLEAIEEAMQYYALNRELIEIEALEEKRILKEKGYNVEPKNLS